MDAKGGHNQVKLKGRVDKRVHYDVEIKGWMVLRDHTLRGRRT